LTTLDVGNNEIEEIENISHLIALEEFWVSYPFLHKFLDIADLVGERE